MAPQLRAITALGLDLGFGFFMGFSNLFSFLTLFCPPSSSPSPLHISQPHVNLPTSNIPSMFHACVLLLASLLKAPLCGLLSSLPDSTHTHPHKHTYIN